MTCGCRAVSDSAAVCADQIAVEVDIHALAFNGPAANGMSGANGAAQAGLRAGTAKQPAMNGTLRGSSKAAPAGGKGALKGGEKKDPAQLKREQQLAEEAAVRGIVLCRCVLLLSNVWSLN